MTSLQMLERVLLGVALAVSLITDLSSRRILDVVTLPTVALVLILRFLREGLGDLEHGVLTGVVAGAGAAALFSVMARRGGLGWGDVKLVAAVGAALGYPLVMAALVFIALVGAAQALVTLLWHGALGEVMSVVLARWGARAGWSSPKALVAPRRQIPYGVAIALGSVWALVWQRGGL